MDDVLNGDPKSQLRSDTEPADPSHASAHEAGADVGCIGTALDPEHTFETYITDSRNRFPHAAATAVANTPGVAYNPLFVYGDIGVGKSHLLHAIGNQLCATHPEIKLACFKGALFSETVLAAHATDSLEPLREYFRHLDLFILDDFQTLAADRHVHTELATIMLAFYSSRRQLILAADRPVADIDLLDSDILTLLKNGLMVRLKLPDIDAELARIKRAQMMQRLSSRFSD